MKKFAKILFGTVALFVLAGYGIFQLPAFGGRFAGERLERMRRSPEFIDGRFQNTPPQKTDNAFWQTLRLYRQGQIREPQFEIPVIALSPSYDWGWATLLAPLFMYWILVYVTGIPPLEAQMLRSRGERYRAYQARTSIFFPLPARRGGGSTTT